jgi:hypothetical protein
MTQLNKLQIKAELMMIMSKLQSDIDYPYIEEYLSILHEQEDKTDILEILLKEFHRANEARAILLCIILVRLFDQPTLEDFFWNALKNPQVNDISKSIILNVLKSYGKSYDLDEVQTYFENPQNVVDSETKQLLDNAILNPEAQIDFIDFLNSLSVDDKKTLIYSLAEDYSSDELANLLSPIVLYTPDSELGKECIEILGDTKSQLALYSLQEVLNFSKDDSVKNFVKKNISKLKLAGIREENAIEFYQNVLKSVPYEAYASYPDGHGNQAVIFSREKEDAQLQMVAIVINDTYGIVDCFGFNSISKLEFNSVVDKFYGNDERIYLDEHNIKSLLMYSEKLNREHCEEISYEYICWRNLFADVSIEDVPIDLILRLHIKPKNISDIEYERFCMMNFIQKWFFTQDDNDKFKEMILDMDNKVRVGDFDIDLESLVEQYSRVIFDDEKQNLLDKRLLMSSYLKYLSGSKNDAIIIFSVYNDVDRKLDLMKNILRKSIYEHYVSIKYNLTKDDKTKNIFSLKNKAHESIDISLENVKKMIKKVEKLWVI